MDSNASKWSEIMGSKPAGIKKKNVYTGISDTHELVKIYILKTLIQILIL